MVVDNTIAFFVGYLAGSIPFGLLIASMAGAGDVRSIGSGNIGATNVLRTGRKDLAVLTLLADMLKGFLVVLYFQTWSQEAAIFAGFGAFLGHLYPVWLRFKGGKGVATYVGILLAFSFQGFLLFAVIWLAVAAIFRYSSLAALTATLAIPPFFLLKGPDWYEVALLFAVMTVMIWIKHRANITRLLDGTESKIGGSKSG